MTIPAAEHRTYNREAMDLGPYILQILVGMLAVSVAAFLALVCDYIRENNQQIREVVGELRRIRRIDVPSAAGETHPPAVSTVSQRERSRVPAVNRTRPTPSSETIAAVARGERLVAQWQARTQGRSPAAIRLASVAEKMLAGRAASKSSLSGMPSGFGDERIIRDFIANGARASGLVISIGAHDADGSGLPADIQTCLRSLLGPDDFGAQPSATEFVLIFPRECGASAQRKLTAITESLWEIQVRSLGKHAIQFSWGGVEVQDQPLAEAIAAARERMEETRQRRATVSMTPRLAKVAAFRQAV